MKRPVLLAVLAVLLPASTYGQSETPILTGRAAIERISGNTIVLAPAMPMPTLAVRAFIYFSPDGRAIMQMSTGERASDERIAETRTGSWSIDDQDRLCVVEEGKALREEDCIGVRIAGDTVHSEPESVFRDTIATLLEGNPRGL